VMLRQWDDLAKQADWRTPSLAHFMGRAARCAITAKA
jgi:predicted HD phosphohydrolase